jgi:hypothetical protein
VYVVELHIVTNSEERGKVQKQLAEFCEQNGYRTLHLFWRGIDPEERESVDE